MICPICDRELFLEYRDMIDHTVLEESYVCKHCKNYSQYYLTGVTVEHIGKQEFSYSYVYNFKTNWVKKLKRSLVISYYKFLNFLERKVE